MLRGEGRLERIVVATVHGGGRPALDLEAAGDAADGWESWQPDPSWPIPELPDGWNDLRGAPQPREVR